MARYIQVDLHSRQIVCSLPNLRSRLRSLSSRSPGKALFLGVILVLHREQFFMVLHLVFWIARPCAMCRPCTIIFGVTGKGFSLFLKK